MDFTNDDIATLGDKLAGLDLTDGEREALRTIVALVTAPADDEAEVTGYYSVWLGGSFKADFGSLGLKLGPPKRDVILWDESESI